MENVAHPLVTVELLPDRRTDDPVGRLSRDLNEACTQAVTPHQIAALLEAEGLNDRIVEQRFGRAGVFPLASELYDRVPMRRDDEPVPPVNHPLPVAAPSVFALVMRGPVYLVPILFFLAAGDLFAGRGMLVAGLLGLLLGWSWNQGFGAITYRLLGRGDLGGARLSARLSLLAGVAVVSVLVFAVSVGAFGLSAAPTVFAAGQTAYLIGASTLLVFGRDQILVAALAPGVVIVAASLVVDTVPRSLVYAATILTPVVVAVAALLTTRNPAQVVFPRINSVDVRIAVGHAMLGLLWALLIALAGISILGTDDVIVTVSVAAAAMVLTMGVAEWQLADLRRRSRLLLVETGDGSGFSRVVRLAFLRALAIFTAALTVCTVVVSGTAYALGVLTRPGLSLTLGFVFLGIAFFAGLALVAMDRLMLPLVGSLALAFELGALFAVTMMDASASATAYAGGCSILCGILVVGVLAIIPTPVVHR